MHALDRVNFYSDGQMQSHLRWYVFLLLWTTQMVEIDFHHWLHLERCCCSEPSFWLENDNPFLLVHPCCVMVVLAYGLDLPAHLALDVWCVFSNWCWVCCVGNSCCCWCVLIVLVVSHIVPSYLAWDLWRVLVDWHQLVLLERCAVCLHFLLTYSISSLCLWQ